MRRPLLHLAPVLVLALACGGDTLRGVRPRLVVPLESYDFGAVPVLNARTIEIPVENAGRAPLTVDEVRILEAEAPFRIVERPEEVPSGSSRPIVVEFLPPAEADFTATLQLDTDDLEHPSVQVQLLGKGSTRAVMAVDPTVLDFGRVAEGATAAQSFVIQSQGSADLVVNDLSFVPGTSPAFSFLGSVRTPAVVPVLGANNLPGRIQLTVRYTVEEGAPDVASGKVRIEGTDPDLREAFVELTGEVNRAPTPAIAPLGNGAPGLEVTLDGSGSLDPDADYPLAYKWTLRRKPLGTTTQIADPTAQTTTMVLDPKLPGEYEVELNVTDAAGAKNLRPARATIVATPAQKLLVEMFWDNPDTDVDLHFLRTPESTIGKLPDDCFYQNKKPDWGLPADNSDNPELLRDALTGFGPEVVGYVNPIDTTYRVVAELKNTHLSPTPASTVTVRIYQYGVVKAEFKKTLLAAGDLFLAADVAWPSGVITQLE